MNHASSFVRACDRACDQLRDIRFEHGWNRHAEGSVLVSFGATRVLCTATVEENLPSFLRDGQKGWVTAEYGMLPRSTSRRMRREAQQGRPAPRSLEIQRLIGRSLRAAVDLSLLGPRQIVVDCDVLQADGGTRTAAITGGYRALSDALLALHEKGIIAHDPRRAAVAAISVGLCQGQALLDMDYHEDSTADVDLNVVMNSVGDYIELQGTAEGQPLSAADLARLLDLAGQGIRDLLAMQQR